MTFSLTSTRHCRPQNRRTRPERSCERNCLDKLRVGIGSPKGESRLAVDANTERVQSVNHSVDVPYRHGVERLEAFRFESGEVLPYVEIAYEAWGTLSPARDNVVVI